MRRQETGEHFFKGWNKVVCGAIEWYEIKREICGKVRETPDRNVVPAAIGFQLCCIVNSFQIIRPLQ